MKKRYKIRKEQLERVVESFVMESAAPEAKKHVTGGKGGGKMVDKRTNTKTPGKKDWGVNDEPNQAPEAKKHIKGEKGSGKMVEKRSNSKNPSTTMKNKKSQAPEAKKHVKKGSVTETQRITEAFEKRKIRKIFQKRHTELFQALEQAMDDENIEAYVEASSALMKKAKAEYKQLTKDTGLNINLTGQLLKDLAQPFDNPEDLKASWLERASKGSSGSVDTRRG